MLHASLHSFGLLWLWGSVEFFVSVSCQYAENACLREMHHAIPTVDGNWVHRRVWERMATMWAIKKNSVVYRRRVKCCVVYLDLNQPELRLDCQEDLRESQPLLSMSYVPEITTAKRKPLIHAEAVALSNDTWQILRQGESQPASRLTVPAELPQSIPTLLVSVSPNESCSVYLGRSSNSAASVYWSQVDYRINTIQMDGSDSKLL